MANTCPVCGGKLGLLNREKSADGLICASCSNFFYSNLFRATQTDEKLRRENIHGKAAANRTHLEVGKKVRQTIKDLGGTMPEDLPTPEKSIKQLEREREKLKK